MGTFALFRPLTAGLFLSVFLSAATSHGQDGPAPASYRVERNGKKGTITVHFNPQPGRGHEPLRLILEDDLNRRIDFSAWEVERGLPHEKNAPYVLDREGLWQGSRFYSFSLSDGIEKLLELATYKEDLMLRAYHERLPSHQPSATICRYFGDSENALKSLVARALDLRSRFLESPEGRDITKPRPWFWSVQNLLGALDQFKKTDLPLIRGHWPPQQAEIVEIIFLRSYEVKLRKLADEFSAKRE